MSPEDVPEEGEYVIGRVIEVKDFGATFIFMCYCFDYIRSSDKHIAAVFHHQHHIG